MASHARTEAAIHRHFAPIPWGNARPTFPPAVSSGSPEAQRASAADAGKREGIL